VHPTTTQCAPGITILWRKCPPLVLLTCVISILLYVNNVYLHSRAVREERRERRGERRGERNGPSSPPHSEAIKASRACSVEQVVRRADSVRTRRTGS